MIKTTKIGRYTVEDDTRHYDGGELGLNELADYQLRAARTIMLATNELDPVILKYVRNALGYNKEDWAEVTGHSVEEITGLETGQIAPPSYYKFMLMYLIDQSLDSERLVDNNKAIKNAAPVLMVQRITSR